PGRFGGSEEGRGKTIVIDYSSPNIAKPFHLGHLRSTVLGHAIRKLYESLGYKVIGVNHLGDWGTQFGFMLAAWQRWRQDAEARIARGEGEIDVFVSLYVRINQLAQEDPSVREEARSWFRRLEQGDREARSLWQYFVDRSKREFDRIYAILGIHHESDAGESFYEDKMQPGDPDKGGLGFPLILKSDGGTTYATRDLAAAFYRETTYHPERIVYVVGAPQTLHFKQLKKILELMGEPWHEKLVHVPFGQYIGMSTRQGNVVFLDEALTEGRRVATEAAESATKKQDLGPAEIAENARKIGAGAVKFFDLKNGRMKDIQLENNSAGKIDLSLITATKGETGPYVQFAYARLSGVLRNYGKEPTAAGVVFSLLGEPEANKVLKAIGEHPAKVRQALADFEPSIVARHLLDVADAVHSFLHVHRIMDSATEKVDPKVREARALLVGCARKVVGQCLDLLGIEPLEKM
ncbi:arginine--tRNA ligase, partial [bacterium]|nr:arginine--tRNA ligase [bacterium]